MLDDDINPHSVPPPAGCLRDLVTVALFLALSLFVFGILYQLGAR